MTPKPSTRLNIDQDYRIFFLFMTLVLAGMYVVSIVQNPVLRQFWPAALFTVLMVAHVVLHWIVIRIITKTSRQVWYILGQGLLAFAITALSGNTGMIFSLYMALIGESIGYLGLSRWSLLSTLYFLGLSVTNFFLFTDSTVTTTFFWMLTAIPTVLFIGMYVTLYLRQSEAREKAQALAAELEAANRQLSEYATRVEDLTIANERQRMARELHDTLSQGLAGLILQLEAADAHLASQRPEKAQAIVKQTMERARATLSDARRAIDDLRQTNFGDLGALLRQEIDRFQAATGVPCHFHADQTPSIPDPVKETLIRAASEALTNVARHAQATEASITLYVKPVLSVVEAPVLSEVEAPALSGAALSAVEARSSSNIETPVLQLEIKDNGLGFDPANLPPGHYGLLGLRERIRLIGGQITINSAPQKGTILTIEIPINWADT